MVANGSPKMMPMPCVQCGRTPFAGYELPDGRKVNLCFEHSQQFDAMNLRRMEALQDQMDRLEDQIDDTWGLPRRPRPARIPAPRVNVHQVNIHGDNFGVVNTGTVGSISSNLTIIHGQDPALAARLKELTEAILASSTLEKSQKQEAADLINELAADEAKPPQKRRSRAVMRAVAIGLGQLLSTSADVYTLWTAIAQYWK